MVIKPNIPLPSKVLHHGATHLLDYIADETGVASDLQICFPYNYKQMLSLIYFLIIEPGKPLNLSKYFARTHTHPSESEILVNQISKICLTKIKKNKIQKFFKLQLKRRKKNKFLVYDLTSKPQSFDEINEIKYDYDKNFIDIEQLNLALVLDEESSLPVCYSIIPGNIYDVKTAKKLLTDFKFLNENNVKFILDRGCYDLNTIRDLLSKNISFLAAVREKDNFIEMFVQDVRFLKDDRKFYFDKYDVFGYFYNVPIPIRLLYQDIGKDGKYEFPIYIHVIRDEQKFKEEDLNFFHKLFKSRDAVFANTANQFQKNVVNNYISINYRESDKTFKFSLFDKKMIEKISTIEYNYFVSNVYKDIKEVVKIYKNKEAVMKSLHDMKNPLTLECFKEEGDELNGYDNYSFQACENFFFLKFVALILSSAINKVMDEKNAYKDYTMNELVQELDGILKYIYPDKIEHYSDITTKQNDIYKLFQCKPPKS
ncbi:MAG: transposase [Deltaproteobacteria bacterium]|jgi:transposase|nr:transposase [Deltaproteobacteria bacterium]